MIGFWVSLLPLSIASVALVTIAGTRAKVIAVGIAALAALVAGMGSQRTRGASGADAVCESSSLGGQAFERAEDGATSRRGLWRRRLAAVRRADRLRLMGGGHAPRQRPVLARRPDVLGRDAAEADGSGVSPLRDRLARQLAAYGSRRGRQHQCCTGSYQ